MTSHYHYLNQQINKNFEYLIFKFIFLHQIMSFEKQNYTYESFKKKLFGMCIKII